MNLKKYALLTTAVSLMTTGVFASDNSETYDETNPNTHTPNNQNNRYHSESILLNANNNQKDIKDTLDGIIDDYKISLLTKASLDDLKTYLDNESNINERWKYVTSMLIRESWRDHMVKIQNRGEEIAKSADYIYRDTVYDVIPTEIARACLHIDRSDAKYNKNAIMQFLRKDKKEEKDYDMSNWNYIVFINVLNTILNGDTKITGHNDDDMKIIDTVVENLKDVEEYKQYANQIDCASWDIKQYFRRLYLFEYLTKIKKIREINDNKYESKTNYDCVLNAANNLFYGTDWKVAQRNEKSPQTITISNDGAEYIINMPENGKIEETTVKLKTEGYGEDNNTYKSMQKEINSIEEIAKDEGIIEKMKQIQTAALKQNDKTYVPYVSTQVLHILDELTKYKEEAEVSEIEVVNLSHTTRLEKMIDEMKKAVSQKTGNDPTDESYIETIQEAINIEYGELFEPITKMKKFTYNANSTGYDKTNKNDIHRFKQSQGINKDSNKDLKLTRTVQIELGMPIEEKQSRLLQIRQQQTDDILRDMIVATVEYYDELCNIIKTYTQKETKMSKLIQSLKKLMLDAKRKEIEENEEIRAKLISDLTRNEANQKLLNSALTQKEVQNTIANLLTEVKREVQEYTTDDPSAESKRWHTIYDYRGAIIYAICDHNRALFNDENKELNDKLEQICKQIEETYKNEQYDNQVAVWNAGNKKKPAAWSDDEELEKIICDTERLTITGTKESNEAKKTTQSAKQINHDKKTQTHEDERPQLEIENAHNFTLEKEQKIGLPETTETKPGEGTITLKQQDNESNNATNIEIQQKQDKIDVETNSSIDEKDDQTNKNNDINRRDSNGSINIILNSENQTQNKREKDKEETIKCTDTSNIITENETGALNISKKNDANEYNEQGNSDNNDDNEQEQVMQIEKQQNNDPNNIEEDKADTKYDITAAINIIDRGYDSTPKHWIIQEKGQNHILDISQNGETNEIGDVENSIEESNKAMDDNNTSQHTIEIKGGKPTDEGTTHKQDQEISNNIEYSAQIKQDNSLKQKNKNEQTSQEDISGIETSMNNEENVMNINIQDDEEEQHKKRIEKETEAEIIMNNNSNEIQMSDKKSENKFNDTNEQENKDDDQKEEIIVQAPQQLPEKNNNEAINEIHEEAPASETKSELNDKSNEMTININSAINDTNEKDEEIIETKEIQSGDQTSTYINKNPNLIMEQQEEQNAESIHGQIQEDSYNQINEDNGQNEKENNVNIEINISDGDENAKSNKIDTTATVQRNILSTDATDGETNMNGINIEKNDDTIDINETVTDNETKNIQQQEEKDKDTTANKIYTLQQEQQEIIFENNEDNIDINEIKKEDDSTDIQQKENLDNNQKETLDIKIEPEKPENNTNKGTNEQEGATVIEHTNNLNEGSQETTINTTNQNKGTNDTKEEIIIEANTTSNIETQETKTNETKEQQPEIKGAKNEIKYTTNEESILHQNANIQQILINGTNEQIKLDSNNEEGLKQQIEASEKAAKDKGTTIAKDLTSENLDTTTQIKIDDEITKIKISEVKTEAENALRAYNEGVQSATHETTEAEIIEIQKLHYKLKQLKDRLEEEKAEE